MKGINCPSYALSVVHVYISKSAIRHIILSNKSHLKAYLVVCKILSNMLERLQLLLNDYIPRYLFISITISS